MVQEEIKPASFTCQLSLENAHPMLPQCNWSDNTYLDYTYNSPLRVYLIQHKVVTHSSRTYSRLVSALNILCLQFCHCICRTVVIPHPKHLNASQMQGNEAVGSWSGKIDCTFVNCRGLVPAFFFFEGGVHTNTKLVQWEGSFSPCPFVCSSGLLRTVKFQHRRSLQNGIIIALQSILSILPPYFLHAYEQDLTWKYCKAGKRSQTYSPTMLAVPVSELMPM